MSYRWIIFAAAATVLGAGAWYFGRPVHPKEKPRESRVAELPPAKTEAPRELPPKLIEVIDLTQAYEPVREHETVAPGHVDPAGFIEEQATPAKIPYAANEFGPYRDDLVEFTGVPIGSPRLDALATTPERIDVKPREVGSATGHAFDDLIFSRSNNWQGSSWPYDQISNQIDNASRIERLNVMPRELK